MPETGTLDSPKRSVGSYLREVRESRGLSLEEAARVTRIGKNYLIALEGDLFDKLPNTAYVKGFLRVYAGYLQLSSDEIIAMYDRSIATPLLQSPSDSGKTEPSRGGGVRDAGPGCWLLPIILLIAVLVAAYLMGGEESNRRKSPAPFHQAAARHDPVQPPRSTARLAGPGVSSSESPKSIPVAASGEQPSGLILKLKVNQDCWLNITIDSTVSQQYDLKAGDLIEWKGEKVFVLDIGNAGGVEAELNGKSLKSFGEPGQTAHVVLKADGA